MRACGAALLLALTFACEGSEEPRAEPERMPPPFEVEQQERKERLVSYAPGVSIAPPETGQVEVTAAEAVAESWTPFLGGERAVARLVTYRLRDEARLQAWIVEYEDACVPPYTGPILSEKEREERPRCMDRDDVFVVVDAHTGRSGPIFFEHIDWEDA